MVLKLSVPSHLPCRPIGDMVDHEVFSIDDAASFRTERCSDRTGRKRGNGTTFGARVSVGFGLIRGR